MLKKVINYIFIKDIKFLVVFFSTYFIVVLFFNYAYHKEISDDLSVVKIEPIYHFLMRYFNLIDGGKFKSYSKDFSLIIGGLIYPLIVLYLIEAMAYRAIVRWKNRSAR